MKSNRDKSRTAAAKATTIERKNRRAAKRRLCYQ